ARAARVLAVLDGRPAGGGGRAALNLSAAPRPAGMADLLEAAGLPWAWGPKPALLPAVTLDTEALSALIPLPPQASDPARMVAEWRALAA
ncbi:MAG TPA: epimerase, partial [Paracoccaceae bacterium]|nr:epimerase [Paracoccaceae bacterium]